MTEKWIRDTGLVTVFVLIILGIKNSGIFLYLALFFLAILLICPKTIYPLAYLWERVVWALGSIFPKLVFGLIFYLLIFPVGFLKKIISGDSLQIRSWRTVATMFKDRSHVYSKIDLEAPY